MLFLLFFLASKSHASNVSIITFYSVLSFKFETSQAKKWNCQTAEIQKYKKLQNKNCFEKPTFLFHLFWLVILIFYKWDWMRRLKFMVSEVCVRSLMISTIAYPILNLLLIFAIFSVTWGAIIKIKLAPCSSALQNYFENDHSKWQRSGKKRYFALCYKN